MTGLLRTIAVLCVVSMGICALENTVESGSGGRIPVEDLRNGVSDDMLSKKTAGSSSHVTHWQSSEESTPHPVHLNDSGSIEPRVHSNRHSLNVGHSTLICSKNYPFPYPNSYTHYWRIEAALPGSHLNVYCPFSYIRWSVGCLDDYLQFRDGSTTLPRLCGWIHRHFKMRTGQLHVTFKTNPTKQSKGFICKVWATAGNAITVPSTTSSPSVTTSSGSVSSTTTQQSTTASSVTTTTVSSTTASSSVTSTTTSSTTASPSVTTTTTSSTTASPSVTTTTLSSTTASTSKTTASSRCKCGQVNRATRIVGGEETEVNEYPWQVGLARKTSASTICGGSLISEQWVLTAAHCAERMSTSGNDVLIGEHRLGSAGESSVFERKPLSEIKIHPNYNRDTLDNDIALLKLETPVTFPSNNKVAPVCMPDASKSYDNVNAVVTGWGALTYGGSSPVELREVTVPTMTNSKCDSKYPGEITANMICAGLDAGGKDSCQGDSGGPLVSNNGRAMEQIGVVSWGKGCAAPDRPGVYARVGKYLQWIGGYTSTSTCSST